jgi:flagellar hook-associated protein 1 FlgK
MSLSTFLGLETALRGLLAHQRALDVTAHNIANANTLGYTRQRAELRETPPYQEVGVAGGLGTGVDVAAYVRLRDAFIDTQVRAQTMARAYHEAREGGLRQVELALSEPSENGLSALLDGFWSAWHDLASTPESPATRQALLQAGAALAGGLQSLRAQLVTVDGQVQTATSLAISELNGLVAEIASLDQRIMDMVASGLAPSNDLLDRRDLLIDRASALVNLSATEAADGSVTLQVGSLVLLQAGVQTPVGGLGDLAGNLSSGKLAGLVALDQAIAGSGGYLERLDAVAAALIQAVNAVQLAGYTLSGAAAATPFFSGSDSQTIAVEAALMADPTLIAASSQPGQPGNGENALAAANLRGSAAIDGAYQQLVTSIGSDSREAQRSAANAAVLADALENRRDAVIGVSLDEEMANLVRFQRGYQAAARALSAMDEMLETLVTRTGRVGL